MTKLCSLHNRDLFLLQRIDHLLSSGQEWLTCTILNFESWVSLHKTSHFHRGLIQLITILYTCNLTCEADVCWRLFNYSISFHVMFPCEMDIISIYLVLILKQNGSLYLRIPSAAEKKMHSSFKRETGFLSKVCWNLKSWRERGVLFELLWVDISLFFIEPVVRVTVRLWSRHRKSVWVRKETIKCPHAWGTCHAILCLKVDKRDREFSMMKPKRAMTWSDRLMKPGWLMACIGWQITPCRFYLVCDSSLFKVTL